MVLMATMWLGRILFKDFVSGSVSFGHGREPLNNNQEFSTNFDLSFPLYIGSQVSGLSSLLKRRPPDANVRSSPEAVQAIRQIFKDDPSPIFVFDHVDVGCFFLSFNFKTLVFKDDPSPIFILDHVDIGGFGYVQPCIDNIGLCVWILIFVFPPAILTKEKRHKL